MEVASGNEKGGTGKDEERVGERIKTAKTGFDTSSSLFLQDLLLHPPSLHDLVLLPLRSYTT